MDRNTISYINGLLSSLNDKNLGHIKMTFKDITNLNIKDVFDTQARLDKTNIFGNPVEKIYGNYSITEIIESIIKDPTKLGYTEEHIEFAKIILEMILEYKKTIKDVIS